MSSRWDYRSFDAAVGAVLANSRPITDSETVPLDSAVGRVMAETVRGTTDIPPWDRSAIDGFAVRSGDLAEGRETVLRIIGEVKAGAFFSGVLRKGECVRIATGAPIPEGADAAVMFERVEEKGEEVRVPFAVKRWEEVSRKGVDIKKGGPLARERDVVTIGTLGALASQGMNSVRVRRRPVVAVLPGGDEIAPAGSRARRGQIYDVNSHTIAAIVTRSGGIARIGRTVPDDRESIRRALRSALKHDVCVFSSGSSVGQRDFVAGTIREEGKLLFHGVRVRPGRPTMFGLAGGKPVFGLAGHPVSSFLGAFFFLAPCVRRMAGLPDRAPRYAEAVYEGEDAGHKGMVQLLPVHVKDGVCAPVFKESGAITSISRANGIVNVPPDHALTSGDRVSIEMLD